MHDNLSPLHSYVKQTRWRMPLQKVGWCKIYFIYLYRYTHKHTHTHNFLAERSLDIMFATHE